MHHILRELRDELRTVKDSKRLVEDYDSGEVSDWAFYDSALRETLKKTEGLPEDFLTDLRAYVKSTDLPEEDINRAEEYISRLRKIAQERGIQ